jgi:hypothetical protein
MAKTKIDHVLCIGSNISENEFSNNEPILQVGGISYLTQQEFDEFEIASRLLKEFQHDIELFNIVIWNLQEYYDSFTIYRNAYLNNHLQGIENRPIDLELNRCLVNFLASVSNYLTNTEGEIKRKYGESSIIWEKFSKAKSEAFDNYPSYRFLYHLRNYTQHGGLPITKVYYKSKQLDESLEHKTKWIDVVVSKDTLLNANFKWNAKVREDLTLGPTHIDLNSHLLNFMKCLDKINYTLLNEQFPLLSKEVSFLNNLLLRIPEEDRHKGIVVDFKVWLNEQDEVFKFEPRIFHQIDIDLIYLMNAGDPKALVSPIEIFI